MQFHIGAAQNMASYPELGRHARDNLNFLVKVMDHKISHGGIRVVHRIERLFFRTAGPHAFTVVKLCIRFLDVGTVRQQDRTQLLGGLGAMDGTLVAFLHQFGNQAAMIDMGVSQDHGINTARCKSKGAAVELGNQLGTLEHAAIHQHLFAVYFQQVTRTGYRPGSS